jgi:hypothetical protein
MKLEFTPCINKNISLSSTKPATPELTYTNQIHLHQPMYVHPKHRRQAKKTNIKFSQLRHPPVRRPQPTNNLEAPNKRPTDPAQHNTTQRSS